MQFHFLEKEKKSHQARIRSSESKFPFKFVMQKDKVRYP